MTEEVERLERSYNARRRRCIRRNERLLSIERRLSKNEREARVASRELTVEWRHVSREIWNGHPAIVALRETYTRARNRAAYARRTLDRLVEEHLGPSPQMHVIITNSDDSPLSDDAL